MQRILGRLAQIHYGDGGPIEIPGEVQKRCGERRGQDAQAIAGGDTGATFVIQALREVSNRD